MRGIFTCLYIRSVFICLDVRGIFICLCVYMCACVSCISGLPRDCVHNFVDIVCVCVYTCLYTYICEFHIYIYIYIYIYTYVYICIYRYIHTCIQYTFLLGVMRFMCHTYMHTCVNNIRGWHTCLHTSVYICILCMRVLWYYTYIHT